MSVRFGLFLLIVLDWYVMLGLRIIWVRKKKFRARKTLWVGKMFMVHKKSWVWKNSAMGTNLGSKLPAWAKATTVFVYVSVCVFKDSVPSLNQPLTGL